MPSKPILNIASSRCSFAASTLRQGYGRKRRSLGEQRNIRKLRMICPSTFKKVRLCSSPGRQRGTRHHRERKRGLWRHVQLKPAICIQSCLVFLAMIVMMTTQLCPLLFSHSLLLCSLQKSRDGKSGRLFSRSSALHSMEGIVDIQCDRVE